MIFFDQGIFNWTKKWIYIKFGQRKYVDMFAQSKPVANMVNTTFASIFTLVCKYGSNCGIYHVCYRFALDKHMFAT